MFELSNEKVRGKVSQCKREDFFFLSDVTQTRSKREIFPMGHTENEQKKRQKCFKPPPNSK